MLDSVFKAIPAPFRLAVIGLGMLIAPTGEEAAGTQTPSAPANFPAGVELITVDVVVLNALGRPVSGLTRDDFTVSEDDHPQEIVGFEAVSEEPADEAPGPPSAVATNEGEADRPGRAFVILLDDLRIAPPRSEAARQAAASFLERSARDGDDVTLGTTSGDAWWSAHIRARKSLLLFAEGFVDDPDTDRRGVVAASREANTAVYFVDVRGLVALAAVGSAGDPEQYTSPRDRTTSAFQDALFESAGTQALAEDTGGFSVRNTNDLAAGAQRIAAESRVFYLLGLHPLPGKSARDWRKLRVEVKRPGLRVRARRGYTLGEGPEAAKAAKKEGRKEGKNVTIDRAVLRALDSAHDATGIPLRAIAYVFESLPKDATRVLVAAEFDTGRMSPAGQGRAPGGKLDLSMVATERDTGRELRFDEVLGLGGAEGRASGWRAVVREFDLPPGVAQVRVVVRDPDSGAVGSVSQRFEGPPGGALRLSTPILTDRVEPPARAKARPEPAP